MQQRAYSSIGIVLISLAGVAAVTVAVATQPGCSGAACVGVGDPDQPSATIECPAGLLCYRGQCQQGCNAGTELTQPCESSDSCDSSRPNCVNKFCSVCPEDETCIPTINICRRIDPIPMTVEPERPGPSVPKPNYALDASFNPEGLRPGTDAGPDIVPADVPYTHVVFIDIAQEEDWRLPAHPKQGRFDVKAFDVRSSTVANVRWRGDRVPLAYEPPDNAGAFIEQDCMYHDLIEATGAPLPIDFGDIRIDDNDPMDGQLPFIVAGTKYTAEYQGGAYTVTPVVPSQFLLLSQPRPLDMVGPSLVSLISLTGLGSPLTGGANWPLSSESTNPIPFQLVPASMPGDVDLALPQTLATPAQDLIFRWTPVQTGITNSMRVRVRIVSGTHEIFCELVESTNDAGIFTITDNIPIAASLLERLRIAVGAGTNVPIYFERTQRAGLYAPGPVNEAGTSPYVHSVTLWIRHTLIGELRL